MFARLAISMNPDSRSDWLKYAGTNSTGQSLRHPDWTALQLADHRIPYQPLSLAAHFRMNNPEWGGGTIWATSILTALLFFLTIVLHELSHALVAKSHGLPVRSITLFALGGVAEIEKEAGDARTEFWLGIVGPITSFVIGVICLAVLYSLGWKPPHFPQAPVLAMLMWLGYINIMLAVFNMVPGFPLDGGRVLRAIVWWINGDAGRATMIAARVGQLVAFGFIIFGIYRFFNGAGIGGLWIAFIGWFLLSAARESYAQVAITESLRGLRVQDVMSQDYPTVDSQANLQTLVDDFLLRTGRRCFLLTRTAELSDWLRLMKYAKSRDSAGVSRPLAT